MGWFALAAVVGILVSLSPLSDELAPYLRTIAIGATLVFAALIVAAQSPLTDVRGVSIVVDFLVNGPAARIAAGLVLGYLTPPLFSATPVTTWTQAVAYGAIFVFACAAPHIDSWMRKLSGFKSTFVEFQLATSTATNQKRFAVEKVELNFSTELIFGTLASYNTRIDLDLAFVHTFNPLARYAFRANANGPPLPTYERLTFIRSARSVKQMFDELIEPLSNCILERITSGLHEARIKGAFSAPAARLQEIVEKEIAAWPNEPQDANHDVFWRDLEKSLKVIDERDPRGRKCAEVMSDYFVRHPDTRDTKAFPRLSTTQDVGYVAVSAALFLMLVDENKTALSLLEKMRGRPIFVDHRLLVILAYLRNATGQPWYRVFEPYEESRVIATERLGLVNEVCRKSNCPDSSDLLREREMEYIYIASNNMAVALTDALALGVESSKDMVATLRELAEQTKRAASKKREQGKVDDADSFTDTVAYALLVIEAQKEKPDAAVVREQEKELKLVVERRQRKYDLIINNDRLPSRTQEYHLRTARLHHQFARELLGD